MGPTSQRRADAREHRIGERGTDRLVTGRSAPRTREMPAAVARSPPACTTRPRTPRPYSAVRRRLITGPASSSSVPAQGGHRLAGRCNETMLYPHQPDRRRVRGLTTARPPSITRTATTKTTDSGPDRRPGQRRNRRCTPNPTGIPTPVAAPAGPPAGQRGRHPEDRGRASALSRRAPANPPLTMASGHDRARSTPHHPGHRSSRRWPTNLTGGTGFTPGSGGPASPNPPPPPATGDHRPPSARPTPHYPHPDTVVAAAAGQPGPIRGVRHRQHRAAAPGQGGHLGPRARIPHPHHPVAAAAGQPGPIRGVRHRPHRPAARSGGHLGPRARTHPAPPRHHRRWPTWTHRATRVKVATSTPEHASHTRTTPPSPALANRDPSASTPPPTPAAVPGQGGHLGP